jgi:hypothetical protein
MSIQVSQKDAIDIIETLLWLWDDATDDWTKENKQEQWKYMQENIDALGGMEQVMDAREKRKQFYRQVGDDKIWLTSSGRVGGCGG